MSWPHLLPGFYLGESARSVGHLAAAMAGTDQGALLHPDQLCHPTYDAKKGPATLRH